MLKQLLPPAAVAIEMRGDPPHGEDELFPEERFAIRGAAAKRRREFVSGRLCARRALDRLGVEPCAIPRGARGEPLWPPGVVGSITHRAHYRACALASSIHLAALGIDAERNAPLSDGVWERIAFGAERELPREVDGVRLDALLFSAKESLYKAWFPLAGGRPAFEQMCVSIDLSRGTLTARLLRPEPIVEGARIDTVMGRWTRDGSLLLTAVSIPRTRWPS